MKTKNIKLISIILAFIFSFFAHFTYEWFHNVFTSILFPINESVWEHMKIIYISIILASIVEYIIYKKKDIKVNNFSISIPSVSIIGIILYLAIYYPIEIVFGHNLIISIILLFIIYIICEVISYYILKSPKIKYQNTIGIILIIISYIVFAYLTYNPPKIPLFIDPQNNTYGIQKEE